MPIRVLVLDDQALVRSALGRALDAQDDVEVVGLAGCIDDAVGALGQRRPDVALVDLCLGRERPIDRMGELRRAAPAIRLLVVTAWATRHTLEAALAAGASGLLSKSQPLDELVDGVRRVHRGEVVICPELVPELIQRAASSSDADLSERDLHVLELLAEARDTGEIADRLCLSEHTVRNGIRALLSKLGVDTRVEAVSEALRRGLILPVEPELSSAGWGPAPAGVVGG
jgi:two-component system response regulator DesR